MYRRRILAGALCGSLGGLSGCNVFAESKPEVNLKSVVVRNLDDEPHAVDVEVIRDGETMVRKTPSVEQAGTGDDSLAVVADGVDREPAAYELRMKLADDEEWEDALLTPVDGGDCLAGEVRITKSGDLSVWKAGISDC
ncbi:hypothetical protein [Haladaptatus salinisoli]|uniref:hypothetical protein n=1 Tax=Haladaptatus salinisoli TaxID=2884876 RepID=UPI001D0B942E|nr:hypothetical protein [Haladaptatus salinisoli]